MKQAEKRETYHRNIQNTNNITRKAKKNIKAISREKMSSQ